MHRSILVELVLRVGFAATILVPALVAGWLGFKWRGRVGAIGAALFASAGGYLLAMSIYFENTWSPPPEILIHVPAGFRHEWIVFVADPSAPPVEWHGTDALPFLGQTSEVQAPMSGIVRVRSVPWLEGQPAVEAILSNGKRASGGVQTSRFGAYDFASHPRREPDLGIVDEARLQAFVAAREAAE